MYHLSFSGKMRIFFAKNKQKKQENFFIFVPLTKKQKANNGMNRTNEIVAIYYSAIKTESLFILVDRI